MIEWPKKPIGDVCQIVGGGTPARSNAAFFSGGIPWATVRDMKSEWIEATEFSITEEALRGSASNLLPAGTVIVASRVGLGKVCRARNATAINQDLRGFIPKNAAALDRQYLFYWLRSVADQIVAAGTGATVQGVTLPFLRSLQIPLLPMEEQRRIVAVLDEAFAAIATATANAEKNLANVRELFECELNKIFAIEAEGWERKRLSEVARDFGRGKSRHRPRGDPKLYGTVAPLIQTGDLSNADHWLCNYSQMYSNMGVAQSKLWPKGTVCVAIVGANVGESAILNFEACFPDSVIGIFPDPEKSDPEYVEYLLQFYKHDLKEQGKGTARDNINIGTFENLFMPFPSIHTQQRVVTRLNVLDGAVQDLSRLTEAKVFALSTLKQSLLHRAFTGELTAITPDLVPA